MSQDIFQKYHDAYFSIVDHPPTTFAEMVEVITGLNAIASRTYKDVEAAIVSAEHEGNSYLVLQLSNLQERMTNSRPDRYKKLQDHGLRLWAQELSEDQKIFIQDLIGKSKTALKEDESALIKFGPGTGHGRAAMERHYDLCDLTFGKIDMGHASETGDWHVFVDSNDLENLKALEPLVTTAVDPNPEITHQETYYELLSGAPENFDVMMQGLLKMKRAADLVDHGMEKLALKNTGTPVEEEIQAKRRHLQGIHTECVGNLEQQSIEMLFNELTPQQTAPLTRLLKATNDGTKAVRISFKDAQETRSVIENLNTLYSVTRPKATMPVTNLGYGEWILDIPVEAAQALAELQPRLGTPAPLPQAQIILKKSPKPPGL